MTKRTPTILAAARGDRSQADCAALVGVSKQRWQQWEAGDGVPQHRVPAIAAALGLDDDDHHRILVESLVSAGVEVEVAERVADATVSGRDGDGVPA